jgi:hypothetical protein
MTLISNVQRVLDLHKEGVVPTDIAVALQISLTEVEHIILNQIKDGITYDPWMLEVMHWGGQHY